MRVAVLCGGKGTRLGQPIKCLTEVAGRPFMDWKLEQLERCGATAVTLVVGPFEQAFARYGLPMVSDPQEGIQAALTACGAVGWWTMGDVLLEQPLSHRNAVYVVRGEQIAGLWLDAGLYHGPGPWHMVETTAQPWHINTPEDLARTEVHLAAVHRLGVPR